MRLGIEHILFGVDHLLFVLDLLLMFSDRWMVLKTISAFTLAHSISLAIATPGYTVGALGAFWTFQRAFRLPEVRKTRIGVA